MKDKVAIVCGSSRGMGRAIAREFLRQGAKVVMMSRNEENLIKAMRDISSEVVQDGDRSVMSRIIAIPGDVRNRADIEKEVNEHPKYYRNLLFSR